MSDRLYGWFRVVAVTIFMVVLGYTVLEWWYWEKSGLHHLRSSAPSVSEAVSDVPVVPDPERVVLLQKMERIESTFAEYRAVRDREVKDLLALIANLQRQIQVLTAQRTPVEQVEALRAASRPVRWARMEQDGARGVTGGSSSDAAGHQQASDAASSSLAARAHAAGFKFVQVRP